VDYYGVLTGKMSRKTMEDIRARKRYLRGVGTGFEVSSKWTLGRTLAERSVQERRVDGC